MIGDKKFYSGARVFDRNGNHIGKIAAVTKSSIILDPSDTPVIKDGVNTRRALKDTDILMEGLTSELSAEFDYSKEVDFDTLALKNLEASLKARYPGISIRLDNMDIASARELARTIDRILTKYPQLRHSLNKVTAEDFGTYNAGGVSSNMGFKSPFTARNVSFNSTRRFDSARMRAYTQQSGRENATVKVPEGRELEYVMTHEFGHALDYLTGNIPDAKMLELVSQVLGRTVTRNDKALRDELIRKKLLTKYSTRGLPEFSHMKNSAVGDDVFTVELVAESFADVEINGVNAKELSKLIHKELTDKLKEY
jgi:hypothetical protein